MESILAKKKQQITQNNNPTHDIFSSFSFKTWRMISSPNSWIEFVIVLEEDDEIDKYEIKIWQAEIQPSLTDTHEGNKAYKKTKLIKQYKTDLTNKKGNLRIFYFSHNHFMSQMGWKMGGWDHKKHQTQQERSLSRGYVQMIEKERRWIWICYCFTSLLMVGGWIVIVVVRR